MKHKLYLLLAFGLGVLVTYGLTRPQNQEWGVVVATFGEGARLYGLFESKRQCLDARAAFIDEYATMLGRYGKEAPKRDSRTVVVSAAGTSVMTTFSCLPFDTIRGLPQVMPDSSDDGRK